MIRYDAKLNAEIRRTIKNFNAKIRRLERAEAEVIPERLSITEIRDQFTNRRRLKSYLKNVRRFSVRSAAEVVRGSGGVDFTKWQLKTLKQRIAVTKGRITREANQINLQSAKYKSLRIERIKNLEAKYDFLSQDPLTFDAQDLRTVNKIITESEPNPEQDERFYNSFFSWLNQIRGLGMPSGMIDQIISVLRELSPDQLSDAYRFEPLIQDIHDLYIKVKSKEIEWDEAYSRVEALQQEAPRIVKEYEKA